MKNILINIKKFLIKYLDNIKTCGCRVGMRVVNGKLIIQLEWPNTQPYSYICIKYKQLAIARTYRASLFVWPVIVAT